VPGIVLPGYSVQQLHRKSRSLPSSFLAHFVSKLHMKSDFCQVRLLGPSQTHISVSENGALNKQGH
jgi:hypothetical protein